jgi:hypothetical protein
MERVQWNPHRDVVPRPAAGVAVSGDDVAESIRLLREDAVRIAREDAASGVPHPDRTDPSDSEVDLRERCRALLQQARAREQRQWAENLGALEEKVAETIPQAALQLTRFERLINDLVRLRVRKEGRRREVTRELGNGGATRARGIPTGLYIAAISFLGLVEFFANGPVFSTLLPRDPLTERQIRILSETSDGWLAGAERVLAHLLMRPDAALLAAGVITFLCVLAHFFGHSLRELVIHQDRRAREVLSSRSPLESVVPIAIAGLGLALVLGVLFEARVLLGKVGAERYAEDMARVVELRREAGWLRVDGKLLDANDLTNRADDMEAAAIELREYSGAMARMTVPILLLNLTLVLCAVAAAYFHRRDARVEAFNEDAFEEDRSSLVAAAETAATETSALLVQLGRDTRRLKSAHLNGHSPEWTAAVPQLEAVLALYRAENGRARGMDSRGIKAFLTPTSLGGDLLLGNGHAHHDALTLRSPESYDQERVELQSRFDSLRVRFNEEACS